MVPKFLSTDNAMDGNINNTARGMKIVFWTFILANYTLVLCWLHKSMGKFKLSSL